MIAHIRRRPSWFARITLPALSLLLLGSLSYAAQPDVPDDDEDAARQPDQPDQQEVVPDEVPLAGAVRSAVDDDLLTDEEREHMRLFHGLFDELDEDQLATPAARLARYQLDHEQLNDEDTPALIRAEAAVLRGDMEQALELLADRDEPRAKLLLGRAYEGLGRVNKAVEVLTPLREALRDEELTSAEDLTAAAEAMGRLAVLEGRPAQDYHFIMSTLDRVTQRVDRLHWPAIVAQARLMLDKDNGQEAAEAVQHALTLNPRSSEAWYLLGRITIMGFNFDGLEQVVEQLRRIEEDHVLADVLEVEGYLTQRDPESARQTLDAALDRWPNHRRLLAADVAVAALEYDEAGIEEALARFEEAAGKSPLAHHLAGKHLSQARQYEKGAEMLNEAVERQPNWPAPRIELGLLLSQDGQENEALKVLLRVTDLDPFNKRANNTLALLEDMTGYQQLETEHFIILYKKGIDAALAHDMPEPLEAIHRDQIEVFGHEPERKTLIEILPDRRSFAVRITGMPGIWTVGACTGPVIAITPPREGRHQYGPFDWERVIRHEYTHTITLSQTGNRIPHWFTEAAAVAQEPVPRDFDTAQLLASALKNDELFDLEEINWAFVRPKRPQDRPLAYAQSHWMYEYIEQRFGREMILEMLTLSREGLPPGRVVPEATGESADDFLDAFFEWARGEVEQWGLAPEPSREQIVEQIQQAGGEPREMVAELLEEHPDHPDLLRLQAEAVLQAGGEQETARALLDRYAEARPTDPWADRQLAELAIEAGRPADAVDHLRRLDRVDQEHGAHAVRLMHLHRELDEHDNAQQAAHRALYRQPYNASLREAAATIALQRSDLETAHRHLRALTWIESDRAQHHIRLAALLTRMDRTAEADQAARRARELNPEAPVDRFLQEDESAEDDTVVQ